MSLSMMLGFVLLVAGSAFAQLDITVTSIATEGDHKVATIHTQNNSGKDVASWDVVVTQYLAAGGTRESGLVTDCGYRAKHDGDKKHGIPKLLNAGESYDDRAYLDPDVEVVNVTVKLGAVIYADRTASGDEDKIHDMLSGRRHFAEDLSDPAEKAKARRYAQDDLRRVK